MGLGFNFNAHTHFERQDGLNTLGGVLKSTAYGGEKRGSQSHGVPPTPNLEAGRNPFPSMVKAGRRGRGHS